jgi:hypothetical protein
LNRNLYLFLDESGNFDFSPTGTKYLTFTCLATEDPTYGVLELYNLKHDLIEQGYNVESFHATEDKQIVRDRVFSILNKCRNFTIDSIIVEKCKTNPTIRDPVIFYPKIHTYLLKYVFARYPAESFEKLIIFTDQLPVRKKREAITKALKMGIKESVPGKTYSILHHQSKSHIYLQIVDYCSWAIYVKWERKEFRPYKEIKDKIKSEFDIFKHGRTRYY